jgi:hypothetical protein
MLDLILFGIIIILIALYLGEKQQNSNRDNEDE